MSAKLAARSRRLLLLIALIGSALLTSCGDDKSSAGDDAKLLKITASQPATGQYRFDVPGSVKSGLVKIEFHNEDKVARRAQLVRIEGNHTIDEVLGPDVVPVPDWQNVAGGVGSTQPGKTMTSVQNLPAGKYYVVDTSSDDDDPDRPYYKDGAVAALDVAGPTKAGELPKAKATIKLADSAIGVTASGLKAGVNDIMIDNTSSDPCNVALEPIVAGKTLADVRTFLEGDQKGRSPVREGEIVYSAQMEGSKPGQVTRQVTQFDLAPGKYSVTCYLTTRSDGPSPADRGLVAELQVGGTATSAPSEAREEPGPLKITATRSSGEYEFDVPEATSGGFTSIEFQNNDKVVREAQLIRVNGDHSAAEVVAAIDKSDVDKAKTPTPTWVRWAGGVGTTKPGQLNTTTQELPTGKYYVVDTNKSDEPDSPQYFKVGAIAPFDVNPGGKTDALPGGDASIKLSDGTPGVVAKGLKAGTNSVLIENDGSEAHQVVALPFLPGNTLADVKEFFTSGRPGAAAVHFKKGVRTTLIEGGVSQNVELQLRPGKYAFLCFARDRAGGPRHTDEGVVVEVEIE